ncbi:MBL fold metallo-hydrolase [Yeguia hominis]|uniref:MBL fold metallo-hydrolase n=1 Tax=Yeguia hominis TaxID=2763662 RepID=A0A926DA26_9FIRM|nr:MBL fold metallo-hydrolase [Yeguia hominis]MBC8534623.1 MBL fold metallo-hydrolase [Yeguia hominis]
MFVIRLTFWGQAGFCLEYSSSRLITDPCLSDYVDRTCSTESVVWKRAYAPPCTLADLRPDLILISHGHGDHLDPWTLSPYYQAGGTARIAVPAPVSEQALACSVPDSALIAAKAEEAFTEGSFTVLPIPCAHTDLHTDENGNYQELSYLISCGGKRIFFGGDLSLYDGLTERLAELHPDIMLLPVNGRDYYLTAANIIGNTNCREAAELAKRCKAACLIPMHHDLYAINGCRENWVREAAADAGVPVRILRCGEHIAFF